MMQPCTSPRKAAVYPSPPVITQYVYASRGRSWPTCKLLVSTESQARELVYTQGWCIQKHFHAQEDNSE